MSFKTDFSKENRIHDDLRNQALHSAEELWKNVLLLQSTLFGIVVSLHDNTECMPYTRLVFFLSCILFLLGILSSGIILYHYLKLGEKLMLLYRLELKEAQIEHRELRSVYADVPKYFPYFEKAALILLFFALLTLFSYAILKELSL